VEKYIPLLANLLERDEDILLEEVRDALIRFQSDEVVKAVEPYLRKPESTIFATSVMENIKSDSAVRALRVAYQYAEVSEDQDMLIEALCKQFSSEALPEISVHMKKDQFSRHYDVEKTVYSYYSILGEQHPDFEKWRQTALKREFNDQTVNKQEMVQKGTVHKENKVGRNDPCPCGSGKKHKKCCGK
jgi:preprotein translocase subunit SecA